ncbi:MAG: hypothetical protein RIB77_34140 [Sandaracinaceae bacterium]
MARRSRAPLAPSTAGMWQLAQPSAPVCSVPVVQVSTPAAFCVAWWHLRHIVRPSVSQGAAAPTPCGAGAWASTS